GTAFATTAVTNSTKPTANEVSDVGLNPLSAAYSNATVTLLGVCSYALATNSASFSNSGGASVVGVTTVDPSCAWTVSNPNSWIILNSGTNGPGDALLNYSVLSNPSSIARTGLVTIANLPFSVIQLGADCIYTLSIYNGVHGAGVETGSVNVASITGCKWGVI